MNTTLSREETLCELVQVMLAGGAGNLQSLLSTDVVFSSAEVIDGPPPEAATEDSLVVVGVEFTGTLTGETLLALTLDEAKAIVRLMTTGMDVAEEDLLGELGLSAIGEAMNQLMAGFSRSLGEKIDRVVQIGPPAIEIVEHGSDRLAFDDQHTGFSFTATIGTEPLGALFWVMDTSFVVELLELAAESAEDAPSDSGQTATGDAPAVVGLGTLADLELTAVVELGRATLPIRTLLGMDQGSVIRLGRTVDEPADLYVNGTLAAKGDIVLVDGKLGLRVREVLTVKEGGI